MTIKFAVLLAALLTASALIFSYRAVQPPPAAQTTADTKTPTMEVLSWTPRVFVFHNFLTDKECDHLMQKAMPSLARSTVVDENSEEGIIDKARTSRGMFFEPEDNDPIVREIESRISRLTLMPVENGEAIQVLHYQTGGEYQPHHDYFDPETVGGAAHLKRGGQRVASFLMYLNTPQAGGETIFPDLKIKVTPVKGDALLFFDCTPDGKIDTLTLHGGAPVIKGEKWLATKWLRQFRFE